MEWTTGRAGMLYADLLPGQARDRLADGLLANRIRIERGGPVGDWVHFHEVAFQLIVVLRGRVQLVYEDQGPPFWAGPGDLVVQPPTIRHEVLQTEDGLEVLELVNPVEHATHADPAMRLPTASVHPGRAFGHQRFLWDADRDEAWQAQGPLDVRATRVAFATGGAASVRVLRTAPGATAVRRAHAGARTFFVVRGAIEAGGQAAGEGELLRDERALTLSLAPHTLVYECSLRGAPAAHPDGNVFIVGNSGSGKSTMAKRLAADGRVHVDLDPYAWKGEVGVRRDVVDAADAIRAHLGGRPSVVEGCYADLVEALARPGDRLVWLDLPIEACVAHCEQRPFEPHKWASAEAQDAFLPRLLEFVKAYETRTDALGRSAHAELFAAFAGPAERIMSADGLG